MNTEQILCIIGITLFVLSVIFFLFSIIICKNHHDINYEIDIRNRELEEENLKLNEEIVEKLDKLASLSEQESLILKKITEENNEVQKAFENYCEILDSYYDLKENEHNLRLSSLKSEFKIQTEELQRESRAALENYMNTLERYYQTIEENFDKAVIEINEKIYKHQEELNKIQATYAATKEAQRREEEMVLQADFYSLHLTPIEQDTVALIEELKPRLPEPRVLSMLIWQTFYQKQMTALCNDVLGTSVICGIYKITNKKSGLCYIGQAVNIAERWKQHAKCGLGIDTPTQNKLYRAMLKEGLTNFTFELLESCPRAQLNEKEKYYIELYQSYEYGYNSTGGNK